MRHFQNSVLDFKLPVTAEYHSAPLEVAWASEAIFFVRVEELNSEALQLHLRPQISVDGVAWIDEGNAFPVIEKEGQYALRLTHFGGWLRLVGGVGKGGASAVLTTNLVLKE